MQDDLKIFNLMLDDLTGQQNIYKPGPYWKGYSSRIAKAIKADGLDGFRSNSRIGKGYADVIPMDPLDLSSLDSFKSKIYKKIVELPLMKKYFFQPYIRHNEWHFSQTQKYKDLYYSRLFGDWFASFSNRYSLPDTLYGTPQDVVTINGQTVAKCYLSSFLQIDNYSPSIDFSNVRAVFEIGGGFGALCHTLLHLFPNIKEYLYLDIPPMLYVGTQYLKHFFKDEVKDYRQTRKLNKIKFSNRGDREIFCVCPWQIDKIDTSVDLVWNSSSFQEMTKEMVLNYAKNIDRNITKPNAKVCIYIYKGGNSQTTLKLEDIVNIFESETSISFNEMEPKRVLKNAHYLIGKSI